MSRSRSGGHVPLGVGDRRGQLFYEAVMFVAECQPRMPEQLQRRLRSALGASPAEVHPTTVALIRSGRVRQTFFGELLLPGVTTRSGGGYSILTKLLIVVVFLAIFAFMAWGGYEMRVR